jgi:hypothetical protein
MSRSLLLLCLLVQSAVLLQLDVVGGVAICCPFGSAADNFFDPFANESFERCKYEKTSTAEAKEKCTAEAKEKCTAEAKEKCTAEAKEKCTAEAKEKRTAEAKEKCTAEAKEKCTAEAKEVCDPPLSSITSGTSRIKGSNDLTTVVDVWITIWILFMMKKKHRSVTAMIYLITLSTSSTEKTNTITTIKVSKRSLKNREKKTTLIEILHCDEVEIFLLSSLVAYATLQYLLIIGNIECDPGRNTKSSKKRLTCCCDSVRYCANRCCNCY